MNLSQSLFFIIVYLLFPLSASAEPTQQAYWYKIFWSGLHVGDVVTEVTLNDKEYAMYTTIKSRGLAWTFTQYYSDTYTSGIIKDDHHFQPLHYKTSFNARKGLRTIEFDYDVAGNITGEHYDPPENRDKRPAVPDTQRNGGQDPQSLILQLRQHARDYLAQCREGIALCNVSDTLKLYDGRRLSNMPYSLLGIRKERIMWKDYTLLHLKTRRNAKAGYTDNELERIGGEEPDIHAYFPTNQEPLVPIKITAEAMLGTASALLEARCDSMRACRERMKRD